MRAFLKNNYLILKELKIGNTFLFDVDLGEETTFYKLTAKNINK